MSADKKKILIWGDSWGQPNIINPIPKYDGRGHLTYRLFDDGYNVLNRSLAGGGNVGNMFPALDDTFFKPYAVIWFFTEVLRDVSKFPRLATPDKKDYETLIDATYRETFQLVHRYMKLMPKTKLIILEAQSGIRRTYIDQYLPKNRVTVIDNVRSKLLNVELPTSEILGCKGEIEMHKIVFQKKQYKILIDEALTITNAMADDTVYFTDNAHPNDEAHGVIYEMIKPYL